MPMKMGWLQWLSCQVNLWRSCVCTWWWVICHVPCAHFTVTSSPPVCPWPLQGVMGRDTCSCLHPGGCRNNQKTHSVPADYFPQFLGFSFNRSQVLLKKKKKIASSFTRFLWMNWLHMAHAEDDFEGIWNRKQSGSCRLWLEFTGIIQFFSSLFFVVFFFFLILFWKHWDIMLQLTAACLTLKGFSFNLWLYLYFQF